MFLSNHFNEFDINFRPGSKTKVRLTETQCSRALALLEYNPELKAGI
jgi:hypothetical protein